MVALLTPRAAAAELGISDRQLRDLTDDGALPAINVGRGIKRPSRRYDPADIEAFKTARKRTECRSISAPVPQPIPMTSGYQVVDFQATRELLKSGKR